MKHRWTSAEEDFLRQNYPHRPTAEVAANIGVGTKDVYTKASAIGLHKSPEFKARLMAEASERLKLVGFGTRLQPGSTPWNKGKPHPSRGRTAETQFKPGGLPHTWRPIGTRRITNDGYLEEKVTDTGYTPDDYVPVHHMVWTAAGNPPVPPGYALVFRDGDKRNFAIGNLELVTRRELMARNSVHNYGPEVARVVQLRGVISRQINQKEWKVKP